MRVAPQIFIVASNHDRPIAQCVAGLLQKEGYDVHWESTDLGVVSDAAAETARRARCVLAIWSVTSVTSRWVGDPALEAFERKALVQIEIDPVHRPIDGPCISFANWAEDTVSPEWRELKEALRAVCGRPNGDLPIREQALPAIAATLVVVASAGAMSMGIKPAAPSLEAFNAPETIVVNANEQGWAQGGSYVATPPGAGLSQSAEPQEALHPIAFDVPTITATWPAGPTARIRSSTLTPVEGPVAAYLSAVNLSAVNLSDRSEEDPVGPPR